MKEKNAATNVKKLDDAEKLKLLQILENKAKNQ
jgi:hypothetical protein